MSTPEPPRPAVDAPRQPDWAALATTVRGCVACPELAASRTQVVPGTLPGDGAAPDVVLVGEAPGAQEDAAGVPFVGKAGQLLDTLLAEVGLPRERVAVANVLKCRPPANRKPRRGEVAQCRPWLARQLELTAPAVVVAMGGTAAEWFAGRDAKVSALRGQDLTWEGHRLIVTFHPSAAIRFGPNGAPLAALREDLAAAAALVTKESR